MRFALIIWVVFVVIMIGLFSYDVYYHNKMLVRGAYDCDETLVFNFTGVMQGRCYYQGHAVGCKYLKSKYKSKLFEQIERCKEKKNSLR